MLDKFTAYTNLLRAYAAEQDPIKKEDIKFNLHLIEAGFYPYWRVKCSEEDNYDVRKNS